MNGSYIDSAEDAAIRAELRRVADAGGAGSGAAKVVLDGLAGREVRLSDLALIRAVTCKSIQQIIDGGCRDE